MSIKNNKIYLDIFLQSADNIILNNYKNKIEQIFKSKKFTYKILYLPTKKKYYKILRSPHIYKKSIETYGEIIYASNIKLTFLNFENYKQVIYIIKFLKNNIPLNINITFKLKNNVKTNIL